MGKTATPKLGRQDWLNIGLQTFIERGIEAVRVEPLAKSLNVTRGSFYWHFKNRDDFLEAISQEWEMLNTKHVIEQVETIYGNPSAKLLNLFEIAGQDDRLEKAMRVWAANDAKVSEVIACVDQQRLSYLQTLFLQLGFSEIDAKVRAQIAYSIRLSWFVMASSSHSADRLTEIRLVHKILTQTDSVAITP